MEISKQQGGIVSITVAAVIVTGIIGAVIAPALIKLFRVKNPVEAGIAIGTCSHALGTTKALELGEVQGDERNRNRCCRNDHGSAYNVFIKAIWIEKSPFWKRKSVSS